MSKEINKEQTNTLLNCPFCGGKAKLHKSIFIKYEATVICENCGARTFTHSSASYADVKMNAIKAWNTRKPMQNIVERLDDFREEAFREVELDFATAYANAIRIVAEEGGIDEKVQ